MATYTLTGPSTGVSQTPSSNFTVTMDATAITGTVVVTPNDGGVGGTFTPTSLSFTTASQALTFTYTPVGSGTITISTTNNSGYTNPAALTYTVTLNKDVTINQLLYVLSLVHGYTFPYNELTRIGGMSHDDAILLRDSYFTYAQSRANRLASGSPPVGMYGDPASSLHTTELQGRGGRGVTNPEESQPGGTGYPQTGRDNKGLTADTPQTGPGTTQTGR